VKRTRPPLPEGIGFLVVITAIYVFDRTTHQDAIALVVFMAICVAVIGWFFWSRRYQ
jgi:nicotinamide riboside transporter PnuC